MAIRKICAAGAVVGAVMAVSGSEAVDLRIKRDIKFDDGDFSIKAIASGDILSLREAVKKIMKASNKSDSSMAMQLDELVGSILAEALRPKRRLNSKLHDSLRSKDLKLSKDSEDKRDDDGKIHIDLEKTREDRVHRFSFDDKLETKWRNNENRTDSRLKFKKENGESLESKDRHISLGEYREGKVSRNGRRGDRRLRGHAEEDKAGRDIMISLETLQIVLTEFKEHEVDLPRVLKTERDHSVVNFLKSLKATLFEKLDQLQEKRKEASERREENKAERRNSREERDIFTGEDINLEMNIIRNVRDMIKNVNVFDQEDRVPMKVMPSFERLTKTVLDFNYGLKNGFRVERERDMQLNVGKITLEREGSFHLRREKNTEGPNQDVKEQDKTPDQTPMEPGSEQELAKKSFAKIIGAVGDLKAALIQHEKEWGLREDKPEDAGRLSGIREGAFLRREETSS